MALAAVPAAHLARRIGPGRAAAIGLAVFAGAGLACGLVAELSTLIAARCVQALGGAVAVTAVLELLPATVGSERRAVAVWATAGATGAALGPAVGGLLTELVSWQSIFLIQAPLAIAAGVPVLAVARHEAATGVVAAELRQHRPPAPARQPGAGAGLGGDRRRPLPARAAADRRLAPEPDRRGDRRLRDAAGGAARRPARPRRAGSARARAAAGAILVAGGLGGLALLPKAEVALTLPPQLLVGVGLALVLSALTETALAGRAPQAIHGGWTISARHAGVAIGLIALTPLFTADIAQQRRDAIDAGTAVVLDSRVDPLLKLELAQRIEDRLEGERGKVPTIGPAFEPLPGDPGDRADVAPPARRTPGPARPRRHPRLQPLLRPRRPARPAGPDPDRPGAEGGPVSGGAASGVPGRRARSPPRWPWSAPTWPRAGPPTRRPRPRTPARSGPGAIRKASSRSPSSSRSRRSTAPPASSASAARRWPGRWPRPQSRERFTQRYGIDDAELARAIRAGLLRAVDDAERAGALNPLLAAPAAGDAAPDPARPGDRTDQRRPLPARQPADLPRPRPGPARTVPALGGLPVGVERLVLFRGGRGRRNCFGKS